MTTCNALAHLIAAICCNRIASLSTTMSKPAEVQTLPSTHYWPLFEHMLKEHGLTLTDSEMHEIVQICRQLERVVRHGTERPHQH